MDNILCNYYHQLANTDQGVFIPLIYSYYPIFHIDSIQSPDKNVNIW